MNIAVIPARGGSKRIPRKNIKPFCGRPMIAWPIAAAKASGLFDHIIVSTDDPEIAEVARACGAEVPFTRPESLADDTTGTTEVMAHATEWALEQGWPVRAVCCIYATAPFIRAEDLRRGLELLNSGDWAYALAATNYASPIFRAFRERAEGGVEMFFPEHFPTRSQDLPEALHDAAQFYWGRPESWLAGKRGLDHHTIVHRIPRWRIQDIDDEDDWRRAELLAPGILGEAGCASSVPPDIRIGDKALGTGHPAFIVAEMSGNHGGSLERALEIVRAAKRAGADAIKLQTYTADTITLKSAREDFRIPAASPWASHATLWDLYNEAHTPWEWHEAIFREARAQGLQVFSSPFDESAVDLLETLGAPAYKIASPEITHIPLLERVARTGKPVIVSTGIGELGDIELALATLRAAGVQDIILLKCNTAYPAPASESNLRTIPDMTARFGIHAGLSDHTMGTAAVVAAVTLGARFIEKHFTLDDAGESVDAFFSSGESEFARMVQDIRAAEQALGQVSYEITPSAQSSMRGRRSLYIAAPVQAGEPLTAQNIKCVRPAMGMHPRHYREVLGRRAARDLQPGERLTWDDIA